MSNNNIPLSLYIHFPWCIRKCPYCDFNSFALTAPLDEDSYINALIADLQQDLIHVQNREIISIFMGGGTPSLFSPASMQRLLTYIRRHLVLSDDCEITMEMNPGAVEYGNLSAYRQAGINRLSIGVQSFHPQQLKILGRVHSQMEAITIVEKVKLAGFDNINLDLMYALPEQTVAEALADLQQAVALQPEHLSWYHLTIEPNTEFYRRPPKVPDEETSIAIEMAGKEFLQNSGFNQYEISAYSTIANNQSQHNTNYWKFGDYLGIGAGAHSKFSQLDTSNVTRYWKHRTVRNYLNPDNQFIAGERILSNDDKVTEFMFNALRLTQGFTISEFEQRTFLKFTTIEKPLTLAKRQSLLVQEGKHIYPTPLGLRFLNEVIHFFMQ